MDDNSGQIVIHPNTDGQQSQDMPTGQGYTSPSPLPQAPQQAEPIVQDLSVFAADLPAPATPDPFLNDSEITPLTPEQIAANTARRNQILRGQAGLLSELEKAGGIAPGTAIAYSAAVQAARQNSSTAPAAAPATQQQPVASSAVPTIVAPEADYPAPAVTPPVTQPQEQPVFEQQPQSDLPQIQPPVVQPSVEPAPLPRDDEGTLTIHRDGDQL